MLRKLKKEDVLTIPNGMSLFRLLLIPVVVWLYRGRGQYLAAAVVIVLSAATDIADGKIARKFHMVSDVGKVLDPIADKLTQAAMIICLLSRYKWLWALLILFAFKEGLMACWGWLTLKRTETVNSARWYGKASTVALYSVMMLLVLLPDISPVAANIMIGICGVFMLLSLILYGRFYYNILKGTKEIKP